MAHKVGERSLMQRQGGQVPCSFLLQLTSSERCPVRFGGEGSSARGEENPTMLSIFVGVELIISCRIKRLGAVPPPPEKHRKGITQSRVPGTMSSGDREAPALVHILGCKNTGWKMAEGMFTKPICCVRGALGPSNPRWCR